MIRYSLDMQPEPLPVLIGREDKLVLQGSCFTEHISNRLQRYHFSLYTNPNGIVFNPVSIAEPLGRFIHKKRYTDADIFFHGDRWHGLFHHGRFSADTEEQCLENLNSEQVLFEPAMASAKWLIVTFGTAWVYTLKENGILVANCHKIPQSQFNKRLLGVDEVVAKWKQVSEDLKALNPHLNIIYTVSPVRHLRDGVHENNLSKSVLLLAIEALLNDYSFYFPSYELVMDDLRDYRFFESDGAHPNPDAVNYVFNKFSETAMSPDSRLKMEELERYYKLRDHRPLDTSAQNIDKLKQSIIQMRNDIEKKYGLVGKLT